MSTVSNSLAVYAVLVPGLVTVGVARLISNMPGLTGMELAIFLFLGSTVNLALCFGLLQLLLIYRGQRMPVVSAVRKPLFLMSLCVVSVANGVVLAAAYENAWANRAVSSFPFLSLGFEKYSPHSTLHSLLRNLYEPTGAFPDRRHMERQLDARGEPKRIRVLKVHLKSGGIAYSGYEGSWSSGGALVDELYLSPACRHDGNGAAPIPGAGVFIRMDHAALIEFLDADAADCARTLRLSSPSHASFDRNDVLELIAAACSDVLKNAERSMDARNVRCKQ